MLSAYSILLNVALYLFFLSSKVGNKVPILMFSFVFIRNKFIYYWITDFIHDL